jgi:hypothetical protein
MNMLCFDAAPEQGEIAPPLFRPLWQDMVEGGLSAHCAFCVASGVPTGSEEEGGED